jgi:hypothetical protein
MTGRRSKLTPGLEAALLAVIRMGGTNIAAIKHVRVDERQFYRWIERNARFRQSVHLPEAEAELRYTRPITEAANSGDWRASLAWLERRRPQEWAAPRSARPEAQDAIIVAILRECLVLPEPELPQPKPDDEHG